MPSESDDSRNPTRRHLKLLLVAIVLAQTVMFISYPLGTGLRDDNESAQKFLISEYAAGNFLVGNVRYNTGYALVMAPLRSVTNLAGRLSDRALLLLQVTAYSALPLLAYDMLRRRFHPRPALISALLTLIDPFGLQWAHFQLPGWLIALALVAALWLAQLAWDARPGRRLALIALAACFLGFMSFARFNVAPLVALYGFSFFLWRHISLRQRAALFGAVGLISGGILALYVALIHLPSTGTLSLSCTAGATLLASAEEKGFALRASNGPHSRRYAELLTLPSRRRLDFHAARYPLWRQPGPWVSQAEAAAFLAQPIGEPNEEIQIVFPAALYWHLGPCAADAILYDVYIETVSSDPPKLIAAIGRGLLSMLIQDPGAASFPLQYLDAPEQIRWTGEGWLGLEAAESDRYNGQRIWGPGVALYSFLFQPLNLIKLLSPLALIWALWRRDWLLLTVALTLLLGLLLIAAAASIEPRYYAMLAPHYMILIGCFLADLLCRFRRAAA